MSDPSFKIVVNGVEYEVALPELHASQIRALANIPYDHTLILERPDTQEDLVLSDKETISLRAGAAHVFAKPPTSFGARVVRSA